MDIASVIIFFWLRPWDVWHKSKSIRKCLAKVISFPTKTAVLHMTHSSDLLKSEEQDFTVASKTNISRSY